MRILARLTALILGVVGAIAALLINTVYSTNRHVNNLFFNGTSTSHGFIGLLLVFVGLVGAVIAPVFALPGAVLLAIAGIGFFFVVGWWALLVASPLLLIAAALAFNTARSRAASPHPPQAWPPNTPHPTA
jgi:hypothetical protein